MSKLRHRLTSQRYSSASIQRDTHQQPPREMLFTNTIALKVQICRHYHPYKRLPCADSSNMSSNASIAGNIE